MDMTPEEQHAMEEYAQAVAERNSIFQKMLKEIDENNAMILEAEEFLNSIPPGRIR